MGVRVRAPNGREWEVARHIRWPRLRRADAGDWLTAAPDIGNIGDGIGGIIATIVVVLVATGLIIVLLPFVVLLFEAVFVIAASMFLRRAWVVTAETVDGNVPPLFREWRVRGFFGSRAAVREVADELSRGVQAEPENAE